jgi:hypothetical protein
MIPIIGSMMYGLFSADITTLVKSIIGFGFYYFPIAPVELRLEKLRVIAYS